MFQNAKLRGARDVYQMHEASQIHTEIGGFIWKRMLIISIQIFNFHSVTPKWLAAFCLFRGFFHRVRAIFTTFVVTLSLARTHTRQTRCKQKQNIVLLSLMQQMLNIALFLASEGEDEAGTIQITLIAQIIAFKFSVLTPFTSPLIHTHTHARSLCRQIKTQKVGNRKICHRHLIWCIRQTNEKAAIYSTNNFDRTIRECDTLKWPEKSLDLQKCKNFGRCKTFLFLENQFLWNEKGRMKRNEMNKELNKR